MVIFLKMNLIISYILLLFFCCVRSQDSESCDLNITDIHSNVIDMNSYCSDKNCIVKCCGENEVIYLHKRMRECKNINELKRKLSENFTFPDELFDHSKQIKMYQNDIYKSEKLSSKNFNEFRWLRSKIYPNSKCASILTVQKKLVEAGNLMLYNPHHYYYWQPILTPKFCVDIQIGVLKKKRRVDSTVVFPMKISGENGLVDKNLFTAIAMLISSFFLVLVLLVYGLLPQLRNIQGMLMMAYTGTLMLTYLLKASYILYSEAQKNMHKVPDCTLITQITYFFILSTFFWIKLMSFDIWWTFRGTRKLRSIHRRGINVKFMIYASYAYGVPAALIIFYSIMDKKDLPVHILKPFFNKCFLTDNTLFYLYVPLMILTGSNCLLFVMTMYNIWLIKRNLTNFDKSTISKNKTNQNTFTLYLKLSSIMGVSWILELVQLLMLESETPVWLYVVLNAYNVFIGVIIFFMFVFKRTIFLMICKRLNIENKWTKHQYKVNSSTRSEVSKSSKSRAYTKSTTDYDAEDAAALKTTEETDF